MQEIVTRKEFKNLEKEVEHLKENVAILTNEKLMKEIQKARKRLAQGRGIPLEDIEREILKE